MLSGASNHLAVDNDREHHIIREMPAATESQTKSTKSVTFGPLNRPFEAHGDQYHLALPPVPDSPSSIRSFLDMATIASTELGNKGQETADKVKEPWVDCARTIWRNEQEEIKAYKESIDSLILIIGLFSAVVSVFSAAEYTNLSTSEAFVATYAHVTAQVPDSTVSKRHSNSPSSMISAPMLQSVTSSSSFNARVVNILWFSALTISLSAAFIGITIRQWLNFHVGHTVNIPIQTIRMWHFRHTALVNWRVPHMIAILPILLQLALSLFLVGLTIRIWPLSLAVAGVLAAQLAILSLFLAFTTLAPTFSPSCPYKSPQGLWVFWICRGPISVSLCIFCKALVYVLRTPNYCREIMKNSPWKRVRTAIPPLTRKIWKKLKSFCMHTVAPILWAVYALCAVLANIPGAIDDLSSFLEDTANSLSATEWHTLPADWRQHEQVHLASRPADEADLATVIVDADAAYMSDAFLLQVVCPLMTLKTFKKRRRYYQAFEGILNHRHCWPKKGADIRSIHSSLKNLDHDCLLAIQNMLCDMFCCIMDGPLQKLVGPDADRAARVYWTLCQTMLLPTGEHARKARDRVLEAMEKASEELIRSAEPGLELPRIFSLNRLAPRSYRMHKFIMSKMIDIQLPMILVDDILAMQQGEDWSDLATVMENATTVLRFAADIPSGQYESAKDELSSFMADNVLQQVQHSIRKCPPPIHLMHNFLHQCNRYMEQRDSDIFQAHVSQDRGDGRDDGQGDDQHADQGDYRVGRAILDSITTWRSQRVANPMVLALRRFQSMVQNTYLEARVDLWSRSGIWDVADDSEAILFDDTLMTFKTFLDSSEAPRISVDIIPAQDV